MQNAKLFCYRENSVVAMTEINAELNLQGLLTNIVRRVAQSRSPFQSLPSEQQNLLVYFTWGCDGSTGQQYKQMFTLGKQYSYSDNLFNIVFTPTSVFTVKWKFRDKKNVFWKYPQPFLIKYCRSLRLQLKQETSDLMKQEVTCSGSDGKPSTHSCPTR
jgi:hypothetical protein